MWSLLGKFGTHLQGTSLKFLQTLFNYQQLFDLIPDEPGWLTVVEREVEYAILLVEDEIYARSVSVMLDDIETYYDHLYRDDIDL